MLEDKLIGAPEMPVWFRNVSLPWIVAVSPVNVVLLMQERLIMDVAFVGGGGLFGSKLIVSE